VPAPRKLADDELFATAARLFARHGYDGTSISMLVDELGVTRPTLYSRVPSKRALFDALYAPQGAPPLDRLRGLVRLQLAALDALHESMELLRLTSMVPARPEWRRWWQRLDEELVEILEGARRAGDLTASADLVVVKHAFWAIVNDLPNWYRPSSSKEGRLSPDEVADQVVALLSTSR